METTVRHTPDNADDYNRDGTPRKSCSCGEAWADEPGHDWDIADTATDEQEG